MALALQRIWSFDRASGYEGADARGAGGANVGVDVSSVSSPAPPSGRGGERCLKFDEGKTSANTSLPTDDVTVDTASTYNREAGWIRFVDPDIENHNQPKIWFIHFETSGATEFKIGIQGTGGGHVLRLFDAAGTESTFSGAADPFTANTWHRVTFIWQHSNSSLVTIYVDNQPSRSLSAKDLLNGTAGTGRFRFEGQVYAGAPSAGGFATSMFAWGWSHWTGEAFFTTQFQDYGITQLRPFGKTGRVPDCEEFGGAPDSNDTAFSGDAANITDDSSSTLAIKPPSNQHGGSGWSCDLVGGKRGPASQFGPDTVGMACQWLVWTDLAAFADTSIPWIVYGHKNADGTFTVTSSQILRGQDMKAAIVAEVGTTYFPTIHDSYAVIGIKHIKILFPQSFGLEEAWVDYMYEYPEPTSRDGIRLKGAVTLKGAVNLCSA